MASLSEALQSSGVPTRMPGVPSASRERALAADSCSCAARHRLVGPARDSVEGLLRAFCAGFALTHCQLGAIFCCRRLLLKNPVPKWNPVKWKHGPKPAVCPLLFNFEPHPSSLAGAGSMSTGTPQYPADPISKGRKSMFAP